MRSAEKIMTILEAYDLTVSLRDASEMASCYISLSHGMSPRARGAQATLGAAAHQEEAIAGSSRSCKN